jgi:hypothetical protein
VRVIAELGIVGGQHDVAHHRDLGVDCRRTVDRADDRDVDLGKACRHPPALPPQLVPGHLREARGVEFGAESVAGARDDKDLGGGVRPDPPEGLVGVVVCHSAPDQRARA